MPRQRVAVVGWGREPRRFPAEAADHLTVCVTAKARRREGADPKFIFPHQVHPELMCGDIYLLLAEPFDGRRFLIGMELVVLGPVGYCFC